MKRCFKCNQIKPLDEFYKHSAMGDGHLNKCKECTKKDVMEHRTKNIEKIREYDRKRGRCDARLILNRERIRKATAEQKKRRKQCQTRWLLGNKAKRSAQTALGNAVRDKRVLKPDRCSECGSQERLQGHHDDYTKPLAVMWLCNKCHMKRHRKYA